MIDAAAAGASRREAADSLAAGARTFVLWAQRLEATENVVTQGVRQQEPRRPAVRGCQAYRGFNGKTRLFRAQPSESIHKRAVQLSELRVFDEQSR
jgi:hypothetical protein